jgi:hypothetical protein
MTIEQYPTIMSKISYSYDFAYDANVFPTKYDMFMCLRDTICSEEKDDSDYANLCFNNSILNETLIEVHMRELKRFIRNYDITRDEAIRSLIQILYESTFSNDVVYLIDQMFRYLITEETNNKRPSIPYDLLFDPHFKNVSLETEVFDGNYRWRGYLIDTFSHYYINFDASSYADWSSIKPPTYVKPDSHKMCDDCDRFIYIKGYSSYLRGL